jgi:hypothetical protein
MIERRETCFILGSGASLNDLTPQEREYLNGHSCTLAFNKYLLFWDEVGIIPTDFFLTDRHFPAHIVLARSIQISRQLQKPISFYLDRFYAKYCSTQPRQIIDGLRHRLIIWKKYRFWIPFRITGTQVNYFQNILANDRSFRWATTLSEPLYFYRGSLSSVINLATIIYPECDIKLLGVDLNSNEYFYGDRIKKYPELLDRFYFLGNKAGKHPTIIGEGSASSILNVMPKIVNHLRSLGIDLTCCNPKSLLVTEGVCSYLPVLDDGVG